MSRFHQEGGGRTIIRVVLGPTNDRKEGDGRLRGKILNRFSEEKKREKVQINLPAIRT